MFNNTGATPAVDGSEREVGALVSQALVGEGEGKTNLDVGGSIPPEGVEKGDHLRATAGAGAGGAGAAIHVHNNQHPVHVALVDRDEELLHVEQRGLSAG